MNYVLFEFGGEKAYLLKIAFYMVYNAMHRKDNSERKICVEQVMEKELELLSSDLHT